jgi:hypothetical protein
LRTFALQRVCVGLTVVRQIVFLSSDVKVWPEELSGYRSCFFIDNYIELKRVLSILPDTCIREIPGKRINQIARDIQSEIVNLDQKAFSGKYYSSWLASVFAEHSVYQTDFFLNVCRAIYLVGEKKRNGPMAVVVDNPEVGQALFQVCQRAGIQSACFNLRRRSRMLNIVRRAKAGLSGMFYALKYKIIYREKHLINFKNTRVLLLNWVGPNHFSSDKRIIETNYYGRLPSWIGEDGSELTWLANPTNWLANATNISKNIKSAKDQVISLPSLVSFRTIFRSFVQWIIFPAAVNKSVTIGGVDVSPLVTLSVKEEQTLPQIIQASLYSDVAKMLHKAKINPEILVYTYENQPWEKTMLQAFRKTFPNLTIIANQSAPFAELYLSAFPSKLQWNLNNVPDKLVVIGENTRNRLIKLDALPEKVIVGGSFRIDTQSEKVKTLKPLGSLKKILVSCPMHKIDTLELACKSIESVSGLKGFELLINFHPANDKQLNDDIVAQIKKTYDISKIRIVDVKAADLFDQIDLLLYSSSGTVFEALLAGIQCIYVGPLARLDMGKLKIGSGSIVRTTEDIRAAISYLGDNPLEANASYLSAVSKIPNNIAPVNKKLWMNLIKT